MLDNLSVHKGERVRQAIEAKDCQVLFLPAYSPDLTPIEEAFSKLKAWLRRLVGKGPLVPGHAQRLDQHHIELIQALVLQHQRDAFAGAFMPGPEREQIQHLVEETEQASYLRRLKQIHPDLPLQQRKHLSTLELMRSQTQIIRNWGYPQHMTRVVSDLFAPLDRAIEQHMGVKVVGLISMCRELIALIERRMNDYLQRLRPMAQATTIRSAVDEYQRAFPHLDDAVEEILQVIAGHELNLPNVRKLLLMHADLHLPDQGIFMLGKVR